MRSIHDNKVTGRVLPFCFAAIVFLGLCGTAMADEPSRYMGGPVKLVEAPNGAVVNAEVLETLPRIAYFEPTVEEVAEGVWSIGGYSLANTTVIEGEGGLIVYDTGDTREEAEHIREAIDKIGDKPVKVIIYSHSHYALGGGALVDDPDDVVIIGHPTLNETVENNVRGGGSPSAIPEVGPVMTPGLWFNSTISCPPRVRTPHSARSSRWASPSPSSPPTGR